jgi:glycosyltransferase involved in cell wall biosynthesis
MGQMRVLFVSSGNSKNGLNPIIRKQGESLIKSGVDLHFYTIKGKGLLSYIKGAIELRRIIKSERYNVIHAHYALCMYVAWFAQRKEKLMVSFMGSDLLGTNELDGSFTWLGKLLARFHVFFAKLCCEHVIVKSKGMANVFGSAHSNLSVIANGVDMECFKPEDRIESRKMLNWSLEKKYIIFVSNPSRVEKNYPLAYRSVELMQDSNVELVAVYQQELEQLRLYYSACDVVLMTSFHEGSPNVIKEAMACNCNVVCTDIGDVNEVFGSREGCWITDFHDSHVAEKLQLALNHDLTSNDSRAFIYSIGLAEEQVAEKIIMLYSKYK